MRKICLFIGIVAMVFATSCSKDNTTPSVKTSTFIVSAEEAISRTSLEPGNTVKWYAGDQINVFDNGTSKIYTSQGEGSIVEFTGDAVSSNEIYALYPYNSTATISGSVITTYLKPEQNAKKNTFANNMAILMGTETDGRINFKNVTGFIKVTVLDEGITSVQVRSNNGCALAGKAVIDWNGGNPSVTVQNPVDHVTLLAKAGETIAPGTYYLVVLPCNLASGISVRFNKSSVSTGAVSSSKAATIARAEILNVGSPEEGVTWTNRVNLSALGTANSYVVTGEGNYCFKATKGNTNDTFANAAYADWLWADDSGLICDIVKENDDFITFTAKSKKGNAIVEACNNNNTILWSWHIWLTDNPATNACYGLTTDIEMMDRNLGATSTDVDNVASYGLYYQFGRKDPMPGAIGMGSKTAGYREGSFADATVSKYIYNPRVVEGTNYLNGASSYFRVKANSSSEISRGYEISHLTARPMTNICYGSGSYSWFYLPNETATTTSSVWTSEAGNLWGVDKTSKTMYDPCPAGWRVIIDYSAITTDNSEFSVIGTSTNGVKYTSAQGTTTNFPASGSRVSNKSSRLADTGTSGSYWSSTPRFKNGDLAFYYFVGSSSQAKNGYPTHSMSVRCVKYNNK